MLGFEQDEEVNFRLTLFLILYIDMFDTYICEYFFLALKRVYIYIYTYILMTPENLLMIFMTSHDR